MRKLLSVYCLLAMLCFTACDPCGKIPPWEGESYFLVDVIQDHNYESVGSFIYNENNQLIKALYAGFEYTFEYKNEKVSRMVHTDYETSQRSCSYEFIYDTKGRVIKQEYYDYEGQFVNFTGYTYSSDGTVKGLVDEKGEEHVIFTYDENGNVIESMWSFPSHAENTLYAPPAYTYKHDNKRKPSFGIDYLFMVDLFPFPVKGGYEGNLSVNNIVEIGEKTNVQHHTVCTYTYTYNENDLPVSIDINHSLLDVDSPVIFNILYTEVYY